MLINTFLDTEDFVHLYYAEDEGTAQGCGAGARMASKYPAARPPSPEYSQVTASSSEMGERERYRAPPEPPPRRAADLFPRHRTHYDEPDLDAGFSPIPGEFVQWVSRTADGGTIAMSNYRLHAQPRRRHGPGSSVPLRLIDALEIRDLLHLIILCKNGGQLKCTFNTGDQCLEWWRRLSTAALSPLTSIQDTFAAAYAAWAKEQPKSSVHRALIDDSMATQRHWFTIEMERLGFTEKGAWRVTSVNSEFKLCPSYPPLLVVPASIGDEDLDSVARFRAMRRIPAVVWRHAGTGAVIARSSQPEVGWLGWRSAEDERLLAAFVSSCAADRGATKLNNLLIVDARSYASAVTNRARGGGCECAQYYPLADIQFMCLPNIHHVRRSFQQLRALAAEPADPANWHSGVERTLWLQYLAGLGRAAAGVCRAVAAGRPVLVHCSDGWDRTPQIVATAQIMLDPFYRTIDGFRVLVEREWLDFGHKFSERCGHQFGPEDPNERSPVFLQWLDLVHQLQRQFPCSFQFNEAFLIKLATHVHSCMFGTFLCASARERRAAGRGAACVWSLLRAPAYCNPLYAPAPRPDLWPDYTVRSLRLWEGVFGAPAPPPPAPPAAPHVVPATMTKTRSCDDLLGECEKRTAQRRCSDPSLAPDLMKLSRVVKENSALTDSCVERLADLDDAAQQHDQVDGAPDEEPARGIGAGRGDGAGLAVGTVTACAGAEAEAEAAAGSPEEAPVFLCDNYSDVLALGDASREGGRTRHISITWRSVSESSTHSSSPTDTAPSAALPADLNVDLNADLNVDLNADINSDLNVDLNADVDPAHNVQEVTAKFLEVELNGGAAWSSGSSSSSCEGERRGASQATLCPRPRRPPTDCSGASTSWWDAAEPPDGLPLALDPLQERLHQIITHQKKVVEDLTGQLRECREALRRASPPPAPPAPRPPPPVAPPSSSSSRSSRSSGSGSASEVEVGEEARGVTWLPDSAAPRCQHCHHHFWLARRRHHCRRCGGIFCGSCAELSPWGSRGHVRMCAPCRAR